MLASDGSDLAAAMATIEEIGSDDALGAAIADAFPGGSIDICDADGYFFELEMRQHGLLRSLKTPELSDGIVDARASAIDDPQRAGDQFASRSVAALGPADRPGIGTIPDHCCLACSDPGIRVTRRGRPANRSGERTGRDARA